MNLVSLLGQCTVCSSNHRLWNYGLDGGPQVQIKSNALTNSTVEWKTRRIAKRKRTTSQNIDEIEIIWQRFRKSNDHLTIGIPQTNVSRGD